MITIAVVTMTDIVILIAMIIFISFTFHHPHYRVENICGLFREADSRNIRPNLVLTKVKPVYFRSGLVIG